MLTSSATFPQFQTLKIDNYPAIASFVNSFPIYSDFNAVSLLTWGVNNSVQFSFLDGNLIISLRDYNTQSLSFSLLGKNNVGEALLQVSDRCSVNSFERIPEIVAHELQKQSGKFEVEPSRDEDDYVYSLATLVTLEGPDYRKFRRSLSNFHSKNNLNPKLEKVEHWEESLAEEILSLTKRWRNIRDRGFEEASFEYYAIRRALRYASDLPIDTWTLTEEGRLLGYIITEDIGDTTVLHFEKADTTIPGLGSFLKYQVFTALHEKGQRLLNYEQDLGVPGLRDAKMSLKPIDFMRKYTVKITL